MIKAEQQLAVARSSAATRSKIAAAVATKEQDELVRKAANVKSSWEKLTATAKKFAVVATASFVAVKTAQASLNVVVRTTSTMFNLLGRAATGAVSGVASLTKSVSSSVSQFVAQRRAAADARRELSQYDGNIRSAGNNMRGLVGTVNNLNRSINIFGASIRQIGQAFQNFGTLTSVYLSLPIGLAFRSWITDALDFQHALIEVRKNADLVMESLDGSRMTVEQMGDSLMELSLHTPTSAAGLAEIASQGARMGVATSHLIEFTEVIDQLVVSTDLAVDDAATAMGRLVNIFYGSGEQLKELEADYVGILNKIGSAINELGKANAVAESEIVAATMRFAPAARTLEIPIADVLAIAATTAAASASPERAGTQLASGVVSLAREIKAITKATGEDIDAIASGIVSDPAEALYTLVNGIAAIENPIERLKVNAAIFGGVGSKAFAILGAGSEKLAENIATANIAFDSGTSLALEFAAAMDSVQNQLGILRNSATAVGYSFAKAFLPVITQVTSYLVPILRALAKMVETLDDRTKLLTIAFVAFLAVLGPISIALGSILFSLGIFYHWLHWLGHIAREIYCPPS
ncbi:MAG: phage tail tape measure protein [Nanoarchaeota archaeon]|nr:phage tail tape measure protein [Nanoarchaeota archaeon]